MNSATLQDVGVRGGSIPTSLIIALFGVIVFAAFIYFCRRGWRPFRGVDEFEIDEAELGVGQQKVKLRANRDDLKVAYQLWVELSTRKVGLPINYDDDVIVEVYDSWYQFFAITRELIKDIPPSKLRNGESIQGLIQLAIDVLNEGLRPHLTRWQARFRRWYENELLKPENLLVEPQELQKRFPKYDDLTKDMELVNARLIYYRSQMRRFVFRAPAGSLK